MERDVIWNEFAPIIVNCWVSVLFKPSIAVKIPTRAIMPKAMIDIVRIALTLFDLIALNATLTFSANNVNQFNRLPPDIIKNQDTAFFITVYSRAKMILLLIIFNNLVVYLFF
jgi:hypothetical protein